MRKPKARQISTWLTSSEVASVLGISLRTLRRKLAAGEVPEPQRNADNNYRQWRPEDVENIRQQFLREEA